MKIESGKLCVNGDVHKAFARISNFSDLGGMMPPQVQDWKSTQDTCSFNAGGMAQVSMRISQRIEPSLVTITSEAGTPFQFAMFFKFEPDPANPSGFISQVETEVDINPIMGAVVKGQLKKLVETLNERIKAYSESIV